MQDIYPELPFWKVTAEGGTKLYFLSPLDVIADHYLHKHDLGDERMASDLSGVYGHPCTCQQWWECEMCIHPSLLTI